LYHFVTVGKKSPVSAIQLEYKKQKISFLITTELSD